MMWFMQKCTIFSHPISISLSLSVEQKHVNEQFVQIYET